MGELEDLEQVEQIEDAVEEFSDAELQEFNDGLVEEVRKFIDRNSERNSKQVKRIRDDRNFCGGQQFDENDRINRTEDRCEVPVSVCQNVVAAVVNPMSAKPFRTTAEVKPEFADLFGDSVNVLNGHLKDIQDEYETSASNDSASYDQSSTGLGFCYATTEEVDGEVVVGYHAIEDTTKVIWDADSRSVTMEDAKQAVVIELIGKTEAEERYGTDIWGGKKPSKTVLGNLGSDFEVPEGLVPLLTYFRVDGHSCEFHRLIGEQVVESDLIEGLSRIPIIAFIGEKTWIDDEHVMTGLIHRLRNSQKKANYANSQMMERLSMSNKVAAVGPAKAFDGFEDEWANSNYTTNGALRYNDRDKEGKEIKAPTMVPIECRVDDLQNVINSSFQEMQFSSGVSPNGIVEQTIKDDATATEVLLRTKSNQSNVSHYLKHARESIKAAGNVLSQLIITVYGLDIPEGVYEIKVDEGCVELTKNEEDRRCLLAIMQFAPENMKGLLAMFITRTLDMPQAKMLADMMLKLLPPEVQQAALGSGDAQSVALLKQQIAQLTQQNQQLMQQYQELNIQTQELQLRTKSDLAIKQIDAQVQLQKQKMANDNAILLKQMDLQANAQQKQFDAQVESARQDKEIVANAQAEAAKAERDLNAEIAKAKVNARIDVEKDIAEKQAEASAQAAAMLTGAV